MNAHLLEQIRAKLAAEGVAWNETEAALEALAKCCAPNMLQREYLRARDAEAQSTNDPS